MSSHTALSYEFYDKFVELVHIHSKWSQETFGDDSVRGPVGPLKHLEKEAREAQQSPNDKSEYADCLLLLLDASRRAGIKPLQLVEAALEKMQENINRKWPKPDGDNPVEHIKESI